MSTLEDTRAKTMKRGGGGGGGTPEKGEQITFNIFISK